MKRNLRKGLTVFSLLLAMGSTLFAQENEEKDFGIKFSGFVKNDAFLDSRQTVAAREGHFLLWPSPELLDANNEDINAGANFNMLAVQSRLSGKITGPDAFGAKTSGLIEGDFFAQANDNINLFRMRHAMIKLNWSNGLELLTGQYWNPLFVTGCFPGTVSFNTGTPLQSFARNPQIRVTQTMGNIKVVGAILSQRDYVSIGPDGSSSKYLRNSGFPDVHLQVHYGTKEGFLAGAGVSYKTLVPRLQSITPIDTFKVKESVSSMAVIGFVKAKLNPVTIKLQARYGENLPDVLAIGGYAVRDVKNATTQAKMYTPLTNMTLWTDIHTNGKKVQAGIFAGYCQNLGTKKQMVDPNASVYTLLGADIENLLRVSPRIIFNSGKYRLAAEMEYTAAAYADAYDADRIATSTTAVANTRFLVAAYYFF